MPRKTNDPIGCIPSVESVRRALADARLRVETLEYLLEIAKEVEGRLASQLPAAEVKRKGDARG